MFALVVFFFFFFFVVKERCMISLSFSQWPQDIKKQLRLFRTCCHFKNVKTVLLKFCLWMPMHCAMCNEKFGSMLAFKSICVFIDYLTGRKALFVNRNGVYCMCTIAIFFWVKTISKSTFIFRYVHWLMVC